MSRSTSRPPSSSPDEASASSPSVRRRSGLWLNVGVALASLLVFFALFEGVLAVVGVTPLSRTEDPYFGFAAGQPLFLKVVKADGAEVYETNPVKLSHFNFQSFPARKQPGTFRIFTLGGSTTYGHPWRDSTSFSGWLRELLAGLDTSAGGPRRFEVINAGGISYASYRATRLAAELARFEPDLFVVYNGHNEFLEERTYREARDIPAWIRNLSGLLDHTRTYSAMRRLAGAGASARSDTLAAEVDDVLARTIGPSSYVRDDALRARVLEHYEESQARVGRIAAGVGAKVIYLTTPSNEMDCAPFKSEPTPGLSGADSSRVAVLRRDAEGLLASGAYAAAWEKLEAAAALDPRNADLQYAAGRAALAARRPGEARARFRRAIDEDVCPLRALTPMHEIERRVARAVGGGFVDFEDTLRAVVAPRQGHNVLGEPDFTDHVHLTVEHYGLMARGILAEMVRMGLVGRRPDSAAAARAAARVHARLTPAEEGLGYHNIAKVLNWGGKTAEAARAARRGLALDSVSPEAASSHQLAGADDERAGRAARALAHYRGAFAIDSNNAETRRLLGQALMRAGGAENLAEAGRHLTIAWQLGGGRDARLAEQVGLIALDLKRYDEAVGPLRSAAALSGGDPGLRLLLTQALLSANRVREAERELRDLVTRHPRVAEAWMRLGMIAEFEGRFNEAAQYYQSAVQADPTHAAAQSSLRRLTGP